MIKLLAYFSFFFLLAGTPPEKKQADGFIGTYQWSNIDTAFFNGGTTLSMNHQVMTLKLNADMSYTEDHENFQCFANMPDFAGSYELTDSFLVCHPSGLWINNYDKDEKPSVLHYASEETYAIKYRIKNDSLISLKDPKIRLCKVKDDKE